MSIIGAMNNAVDALIAQSSALGTISQNIANSETTGYKACDTQFSTLLSQNSNDTTAYGVIANRRDLVRSQGLVELTGNTTDVAIDGKGFFVINSTVDGSGSTYYTRNGSFTQTPASSTGTVTYLTDTSGDYIMGWPGAVTAASGSPTAISYDQASTIAATGTTAVTLRGTIPNTSVGATTAAVGVYDDTGTGQTLTFSLTPTGTTGEWTVVTSLPASVGTVTSPASTTLTFDSNGNVTAPSSAVPVSVTWADGTSSTIAVDPTALAEDANSTTPWINQSTVDGYPAGKFKSVSMDTAGTLSINYDNGQSVAVATLALAQFIEPDNLNEVAGTRFSATTAAGAVTLGTATSLAGQTDLAINSLENSTVNIDTEFTTMVGVQQAYSSASQLWGVGDKMMQTLRDLVT